eukprot:COSAG04_NODE_163_length_21807_cov_8.304580_1_plen_289_part_10
MIMEQAEAGAGGLEGLNATAVGTLRRWFVGYVVGLGWRARETGGAEGSRQMTVVGTALQNMGEQEEAIELLGAAAAGWEAAGDEGNAAVARSNLAKSLINLERHAEARPLLEAVLAFRTERDGAEHEGALKTRGELACCMAEMGEPEGAMREEEAVLAIEMRTLGPTHHSTLVSRQCLAGSYERAGDHDRAAREKQAVVEGFTATLGPRHADTLYAQASLAYTLGQLGDAAGAAALLEVAAPGLEAAGHFQAAWARGELEYARQDARRNLELARRRVLRAAQPEPEPA